jgi:hypothetical protein
VVDPLEEVVGLRRGPVGGEERGSELGQRLLPMTFDRHPRDLITRLPDLEREAEEYESRARALRQIVAGVRALNGDAEGITDQRFVEQNGTVFVASPMDDDGPRGRDAVLKVMSQRPNHIWKVIELKRELLRRGWAPSPKAVEANLKRMRELGDVECPRYGYYKLAALGSEDAEAT